MQKNDIRKLTAFERTAIPSSIAQSLILQNIEIHCRGWTFLTPHNVTVARGYKIYWPNAPYEARSLPDLAHLIHEIVHIWQYNVLNVGLYSPRWLDRRYRYDVKRGDRFLDFGLEQQASIVEDGFILSNGALPRRNRNPVKAKAYENMMQQISNII